MFARTYQLCQGTVGEPQGLGIGVPGCTCPAGTEVDTAGIAVENHNASASEASADKEASGYAASCQANLYFSTYHDCTCAAGRLRQARLAAGTQASSERLQAGLMDGCVADRETIYSRNYKDCAGFFQKNRADWQAFCSCTASKIADDYIAKPVPNVRYTDKLKKDAMRSCGL